VVRSYEGGAKQMSKRPSFQFYPGDWLNDAALRMVSVPARGLWMDMLCLMHQGSEYGYLKVNHKAILPANLARIVGATISEVEGWLDELENAGVFSRCETGSIFSRRMIRDEEIRKARADGGKLGGNPELKGKNKVNLPPNLQPTPSSSSSSSSSLLEEPAKTNVLPISPPIEKKKRATPVHTDFVVTEEMFDWAVGKGLPEVKVRPETEAFINNHKSKGNTFVDWNAAWRTWMIKSVGYAEQRR
jgi:hypothetical protein